MSRNFEEQVVLITGAGAGIGQAAALAFAREGARMVLNSRSVASTHTTADLLRAEGAEVVEVCGDVALPGTAQAMAEAALQHFGWIDVLVNNAGIVIPGTVDTITWCSSNKNPLSEQFSLLKPLQLFSQCNHFPDHNRC